MKNEETARRLRVALNNKDMRAQELADKTGIGKASISQYLNGVHAPSNRTATLMGKVLDVSPMWLMGFELDELYYTSAEVEAMVQELYDRPELKVLFDASRNVSKEDIEQVATLLEKLKK